MIMEYEKKYKEALEVAKRKLCFDKAGMVDSFTPNDIYEMFPELKESDDERIRKELIGFLRNIPNSNYTCEEMALWLEKQGVQPRYNIGDVICDKSCTTLNKEAQPNMEIVDIKNGMYICDKGSFPVSQQDEYELVSKKIATKLNDDSVSNELREASFAHARKEIKNPTCPDNEEFELVYTFEEGAKWDAAQKHTWSKEDKKVLDELINFFVNMVLPKDHDFRIYASWLKSLKDRVLPQPMQEWTAEDEEELKIALDTLVKAGQHSSAKWLKNVCLVPQNTWKPSDEQMKVLEAMLTVSPQSPTMTSTLIELYEDLNKLRGE
jgi:hypothetical protein